MTIINQDDGAMPHMDAAELAAWRRYVWDDGCQSAIVGRNAALIRTRHAAPTGHGRK